MSDTIDPIRKRGDTLIQLIKEKSGVELDYNLFSLLYLDDILLHIFGKGMCHLHKEEIEEDLKQAIRLGIGCFFGECIRQTFSGEWTRDKELGLCLKNVGNQDLTIFPISTAWERMNGDDTKIFAVTNSICQQVFKQVRAQLYP